MPVDWSRYPPDWAEIRIRILSRSGNRCECVGECGHDHSGRCPSMNGQPNPATGSRVVLTIAHLDHDTTRNEDGNLRAMCQRCHLSYDADHHAMNARRTRARRIGQIAFPWAFEGDHGSQ
jgi:hypothetical protein